MQLASLLETSDASAPSAAQSARRVYLLSPREILPEIDRFACHCFEQLRDYFSIQSTTAHVLAENPEAADIILAPIQTEAYGYCFERLRQSSFYKTFVERLIVYSPSDNQFPALRGLYPSAPRRWVREGWALPAHYISSHIHRFSFEPEEIQNKDILFSFVGSSRTHPIRERIIEWNVPGAVIIDSSAKADNQYWWEKENHSDLRLAFREVTRRSQFVICPRGISASSIRLYEAMEAGAVPVIVADDLELPLGPDWQSFSLRVPEKSVDAIPSLIENACAEATEMGSRAREAWEAYFSPGASVGSMVSWAERLLNHSGRRPVALAMEEYTTPPLVRQKLRAARAR